MEYYFCVVAENSDGQSEPLVTEKRMRPTKPPGMQKSCKFGWGVVENFIVQILTVFYYLPCQEFRANLDLWNSSPSLPIPWLSAGLLRLMMEEGPSLDTWFSIRFSEWLVRLGISFLKRWNSKATKYQMYRTVHKIITNHFLPPFRAYMPHAYPGASWSSYFRLDVGWQCWRPNATVYRGQYAGRIRILLACCAFEWSW